MLSFPDTHTCALGTGFTLSLIQREKEGGGGGGFHFNSPKNDSNLFFFFEGGCNRIYFYWLQF